MSICLKDKDEIKERKVKIKKMLEEKDIAKAIIKEKEEIDKLLDKREDVLIELG